MITGRGVDKAGRLTGESRAAAMGLVDDAAKAGAPGVPAKEVIKEYGPVASELRKRVDIGQLNQMPTVGARGKAIVNTADRAGGEIPLQRAQALKETAQDASSGAYRQMDRGTVKQLSADDMLDTATASGLKKAVEARVPGVQAANQQTQRRLGGLRAVEDAVERSSNNLAAGGMRDLISVGGGAGLGELTGDRNKGLAAGGILALLTRPSTGSLGAIGLDRLSRQQLDQWLRAALAAADVNRQGQ